MDHPKHDRNVAARPQGRSGAKSGLNARRVLGVFAHPDDETLLAGALLARFAASGAETGVLCAAPGDDQSKQKLSDACRVLGVEHVASLRYHGSPMWPVTGRDSRPSLMLADAHVDDVAARIAGHIAAFAPHTVITHSTYGDYGHVDHAVVCAATIRAVTQANVDPSRLYCLDWPRPLVRINLRLMRLARRDITRMGPNGKFNLEHAVANAPPCTDVLDVTPFLKTRKAASCFYSDQISVGPPLLRALEYAPVLLQRPFLGRVRLARIHPSCWQSALIPTQLNGL